MVTERQRGQGILANLKVRRNQGDLIIRNRECRKGAVE